MTASAVESGFLVVADITGYTAFLVDSELEHAHDIVRNVMKVLARSLSGPLRIIEYEGDAVFCCVADNDIRHAPLLLDLLEQVYVAFSDHLFNMKTCTTCSCKACANMKSLDLKLFLHHGRYIVEERGGRRDLAGPDIILLHRLLKNTVKDATGIGAYLLATGAALDRLERPQGFTPHRESYEHFGAVECGVADLRAALEQRRQLREDRVTAATADVVCEGVMPGDPVAAWDFFLDPVKRLQWDITLKGMQTARNGRGRQGPGGTMHCSHGSFAVLATMIDWKPFRYFTQRYERVGGGLFPPPMTMTVETEPLDAGATRIRQLFKFTYKNPLQYLVTKLGRRLFQRQGNRDFARLAEVAGAAARAAALASAAAEGEARSPAAD